jgi:hypothetical protein
MLSLPSRSHPKKQNRAVYTKELTHLWREYPGSQILNLQTRFDSW